MSNIIIESDKDNAVVFLLSCSSADGVEGYDAELEYTVDEENRFTRLMPWILFSTFILNMDRTNSRTLFPEDSPRTWIHYHSRNNAGSMYAVLFSIAALRLHYWKAIGPHRVIQGWSWRGYYLIRALIALTEGGVIPAPRVPGIFLQKERACYKIVLVLGCASIASAVSGLMASGLLQLEGVNGLNGWRCSSSSSYHTKEGFLNFGGWLDERQSRIAVTRVVRDDLLKLQYETHVT
ncbi:hypothetical protein BCR33DRAFT_788608 [Rhizoclosmatium globosum]|uniref:Uncharacterized protein n=1 Tax=Rhizoclosmatium globosum TaxID=329046 RepID=A0A1Y2BVP5_9FUNG|nr:hypothetical protein BCR33DRAFT_788608 [Rhizoclosmatium globosum]|eukprot:ORY38744.1 hypothetical protein BCR33DRAFT_788608 [Rhizoclosmatium globosum]